MTSSLFVSLEDKPHIARWACIIAAVQVTTALLIWTFLPLFYPAQLNRETGTESTHLAGKAFSAVVAASSQQKDGSTVIDEMQPALRNGMQIGEAVFLAQPMLRAEPFSQIEIRLDGWNPGQKLFLFWRSSEAPDQQRYMELSHDTGGVSWHTLPSLDIWGGEILELAIGVFGQPGSDALRLHGIDLHPSSRGAVIRRSLWEWRRFLPWSQRSANTYRGARPDAIWTPVTAASVWAGCGLLGIFIVAIALPRAHRASSRTVVIAGLSTIVIPWLALDFNWQRQLERQLEVSQQRYGGLTQAEKRLREEDANLQTFAAGLRDVLAPLRDKRLFLLNDDDEGHTYFRLRLQFHLLPLNTYNFGKALLPPDQMRPHDHVLLLAPATALRFHPQTGILEDGEHQYRATLLYDRPLGRLFRLEAYALQSGLRG